MHFRSTLSNILFILKTNFELLIYLLVNIINLFSLHCSVMAIALIVIYRDCRITYQT